VYSLRFDADRGPWSTCRRTSFRASTDGPRRRSGSAGWQRAAGPAAAGEAPPALPARL